VGDPPLVCPGCGTGQTGDERFCPSCGMPLTLADREEHLSRAPDERRERARKIHKPYSEGELVTVATGRNQAEADFISNLLLEEGVPSLVRRSRGFDVPDMLAAGPRDVLVPRSGEAAAREILLQAELHDHGAGAAGPSPRALLTGLLIGVLVVALIIWVGWLLS
jgi:hypothetical protein